MPGNSPANQDVEITQEGASSSSPRRVSSDLVRRSVGDDEVVVVFFSAVGRILLPEPSGGGKTRTAEGAA